MCFKDIFMGCACVEEIRFNILLRKAYFICMVLESEGFFILKSFFICEESKCGQYTDMPLQ